MKAQVLCQYDGKLCVSLCHLAVRGRSSVWLIIYCHTYLPVPVLTKLLLRKIFVVSLLLCDKTLNGFWGLDKLRHFRMSSWPWKH